MADNNGLFQQLLEQYKTSAVPTDDEIKLRAHLADLQTHLYDEPQADNTKTALAKGLLSIAPMLAGVMAGGYRAGAQPGVEASQMLQANFAQQAKDKYARQQGRVQAGISSDKAQLAALKAQRDASLKTSKDVYDTMNKQGTLEERSRHNRALEANSLEQKQTAASTKAEASLNKRFDQFNDSMNANKRGSGLLAGLQKQVNQADALEALAVNNGKIASLNPQQQVEAARMLDSLLSQGGQATVAITNELVPKSVGRSSANILQWLTNKPQDAHVQAFTKYMLDTARREKDVRIEQLKKLKAANLPNYLDLRQADPEKFNSVLRGHGFDPETEINEKGQYIGGSKASAKPKQVIQNGHTYILNESTGEYE